MAQPWLRGDHSLIVTRQPCEQRSHFTVVITPSRPCENPLGQKKEGDTRCGDACSWALRLMRSRERGKEARGGNQVVGPAGRERGPAPHLKTACMNDSSSCKLFC